MADFQATSEVAKDMHDFIMNVAYTDYEEASFSTLWDFIEQAQSIITGIYGPLDFDHPEDDIREFS